MMCRSVSPRSQVPPTPGMSPLMGKGMGHQPSASTGSMAGAPGGEGYWISDVVFVVVSF